MDTKVIEVFHASRGITVTRKHMKRLLGFFLVVLLACVSPQLAACGEPRYPIMDSKVPVDEQTHPVWLNNSQIIFIGYELDPANPPKQVGLAWEIPQGVYVWDLEKGTAARDHSWDGTTKWCASGKFRSFLRLHPGTDKPYDLVMGTSGNEQVQPYRAKHWFNNNSCHYYNTKPEWADERRVRRTLLEEHGYLDFGPWANADRSDAARILLYRPNEKEPLALPLNPNRVRNLFEYVEFENAYLIESHLQTTYAAPVWLLKPDGTVTKLFEPTGKAWERMGWGHYQLTKKGLFLVGGTGKYDQVGTTGGYLLTGDEPKRLIPGFVRNVSVSPNGCKIVFVHALHSQAEADSVKALREGKPGTRTLKMIDLCTGD